MAARRIDRRLQCGSPVDGDLPFREIAADHGGIEIQLIRAKRRVPIEIVREGFPEVFLDGGRQRQALAQNLRARQRHHDLHGAARGTR